LIPEITTILKEKTNGEIGIEKFQYSCSRKYDRNWLVLNISVSSQKLKGLNL
jgi:hypothetical protein